MSTIRTKRSFLPEERKSSFYFIAFGIKSILIFTLGIVFVWQSWETIQKYRNRKSSVQVIYFVIIIRIPPHIDTYHTFIFICHAYARPIIFSKLDDFVHFWNSWCFPEYMNTQQPSCIGFDYA